MRASSFHSKKQSPAECCNTQRDLFNHDVIAHAVAESSALCASHAEKARYMMQARQLRGFEIASQFSSQISRTDSENIWTIPSQSSAKSYTVHLDPPECSCPDFKKNGLRCKHFYAAQYYLVSQQGGESPEVPEHKPKPTYRQQWPAYVRSQQNEKAKFLELLFALCEGIEEPPQAMGRPRIPLSDRLFAAVFKVYECVSGRRFTSDLREAKQRGYLSTMLDYTSISRSLESDELTPYLKQLITQSSLPLKGIESDFAVDSSGFCSGVSAQWMKAKYANRPDATMISWLKVHLVCGARTHIVTSVEVSGRWESDYSYFKPLVEATAQNFKMRDVVADKAYSGVSNLRLVVNNDATPYIPFLKHTGPTHYKDKSGLWTRLWHFYQYNQEAFAAHYHKRSNVETAFSMIKRKFGERLRSKSETAQINELLCKVLCHNLCCLIQSMYEFGLDVTFASKTADDANVGSA